MESLFANLRIYVYHRVFYHISCCSLYRHIDGFSFSDGSDRFIRIPESWDVPSPTICGLDVSLLSSFLEDSMIVALYSGIFFVKSLYPCICFPWTRSECFRESKSRDTIYHSKIYRLCDAAMFTRYNCLFSKKKLCCFRMNIFIFLECIEQIFILRKPCEHSDLDLRIVSGDESISFARDEA